MKSFFTKLGSLLLCGVAAAVVGCTDFSEDIQAGDNALKDQIESVEQSTAATIAELKAAINALETAQKKMESEYAKKSDLETAKSELQKALNDKAEALESAIDDINATLSGKADKSAVEALQKEMQDAIAEAQKTIANLDAAQKTLEAEIAKKADKTALDGVSEKLDGVAADVETLKNGYQETTLALTNLQSALEGTQLDLAATESSLKSTQADVESLKQAYMETVVALQQFQADLAGKASQTDLELAEKDIEDLKTASAEAVFAITNLSTQVDVIEARVDALENEMAKVKEQIAQHTEQLVNLTVALETARGDIEAEAELRKEADEALQTEVAQLVYGLTNLDMAYNVHIQEYEAYKEALTEQIDALAAQDGALANSILDYYNQAIAAVDEAAEKAAAALEDQIAKTTQLIAQQRQEIEGMVAYTEETLRNEIAAGDEALFTMVQDSLISVVYNTIYDFNTTYEYRFASVEDQVAAMDDEFRATLSALQQEDSRLDGMISELTDDLATKYADAMMAVVNNRTEIEGMIQYMDEELKGLINGLSDRVAANEEKIAALEKVRDQLLADVEELQANAGALSQSIIDNYETTVGIIDGAIAALKAEKDADIEELEGSLADLETSLGAEIDALSAKNDQNLLTVINLLAATEERLKDRIDYLAEHLGITIKNVEALLARVQSIVYVPEYSDGKATINYAKVGIADAILPGTSVLKYKVNAEEAAEVAASLAGVKDIFDFELTDVKTRAASASGADLEIVDVKAEEGYLLFTVRPVDFDKKFFLAAQNMYSASLLVADGNNNLSTEFVNLTRSRNPFALEFGLYLVEADAAKNVAGTTVSTDMPCNNSETLYYTECPVIGFVPTDPAALAGLPMIQPYLTEEDLANLGYAVDVDYKVNYTTGSAVMAEPTYNAPVSGIVFNQFIIGHDAKGVYNVSPAEGLDFDNVGKTLTIKYIATVNGVEKTYTCEFRLSNAKLNVVVGDLDKETGERSLVEEWTLKLLLDKMTPGVGYWTEDLVFATEYEGVANLEPLLENKKPLENFKKHVYQLVNGEWTELDTDAARAAFYVKSFDSIAAGETLGKLTFAVKGGNYAFNNQYKVEYTATNPVEHVDVTTTVLINLTNKPDVIDVDIKDAVFTLKGTDSFYSADADLAAAAYEEFKEYLGFADEATDKAEFKSRLGDQFVKALSDVNNTNRPVVNTVEGPITNLWQAKQARLYSNQIVKGENVIEWSFKNWIDVEFNFTVTGTIEEPKADLVPTPDFIENGIANVEGKFDSNGKYVINQADFGKYFEVDSLTDNTLTVKFVVADPIASEVTVAPSTEVTVNADGTLPVDEAVLNWNTYRGLEVPVTAYLYANGYEIDSYPFTLVTTDPLEFSASDVVVNRVVGYDAVAKVYSTFDLRSEYQTGNLIDQNATSLSAINNSEAFAKYGAKVTVTLGADGVYYYKTTEDYEKGNKSPYAADKYDISNLSDGIIILKGDDAYLNRKIFADVVVSFDHNFCGENAHFAKNITVEFVQHEDPFMAVFANGGTIKLDYDVDLTKSLKLDNPNVTVTLDLNGHTIQNITTDANQAHAAIFVNSGTLIIKGEGTIDGGQGCQSNVAVWAAGDAKVFIEGGNYKVGADADGDSNPAVYTDGNAAVFISGGNFESNDGKFVLNKHDDAVSTSTIEVTGGKFKNFNPADNAADGTGTDYVKDGYESVLQQYSTTDYEVVKK